MSQHFKLAVVNIPASDPKKTSQLYSKLLNVELTRSPTDETVAYSAPLDDDGTYLSVKKRERPDEGITVFFAVENLDQAVATFVAAGGSLVFKHPLPVSPKVKDEYASQYQKVYGKPIDPNVPITMGTTATVRDSEGNRIGLMEVHEHAHVMFKLGTHAKVPVAANAMAVNDLVQKAAKSIESAFLQGGGKP